MFGCEVGDERHDQSHCGGHRGVGDSGQHLLREPAHDEGDDDGGDGRVGEQSHGLPRGECPGHSGCHRDFVNNQRGGVVEQSFTFE